MTATQENRSTASLALPDIEELRGGSTLDYALAYAKAGWYIGPVRKGEKNPGSILGAGWNGQTSRDPQQIAAWFAGTDHGIFLHVGRSGAVVLDVDDPEKLPDWMRTMLDGAPYQQTRRGADGRGHYIFAVPPGVEGYTNGKARLGDDAGWGDIRGSNGVIIVEPSEHPSPDGEYRWGHLNGHRTAVGVVPEGLRSVLTEVGAVGYGPTATRDEAKEWLASKGVSEAEAPGYSDATIKTIVGKMNSGIERGEGRHDNLIRTLAWGIDLIAVEYIDADKFLPQVKGIFEEACREGLGGPVREPGDEFVDALAWAVGQAKAKNAQELDAIRDNEAPNREKYAGSGDTDTFLGDVAAGTAVRTANPDDLFLDFEKIATAPLVQPKELVPGLVWEPDQTLISSPSGLGKSMLAMDIAIQLALGGELFGGAVEPLRVLYIDGENSRNTIARRVHAFGITTAAKGRALQERLKYTTTFDLPSLDTAEGGEALVRLAQKHEVDIVVLDTLTHYVHGEENSNDTWKEFGRTTVSRLRTADIAAIYLDHTGKDVSRGSRGASAKVKDMDNAYVLSPHPDDPEVMVLKTTKARNSEDGPQDRALRRVRDQPLRHEWVKGTVSRSEAKAREAERKLDALTEQAKAQGLHRVKVNPRTGAVEAAGRKAIEAALGCTDREARRIAQRLAEVAKYEVGSQAAKVAKALDE